MKGKGKVGGRVCGLGVRDGSERWKRVSALRGRGEGGWGGVLSCADSVG